MGSKETGCLVSAMHDNSVIHVHLYRYQVFAPDHRAMEMQLPEVPPCRLWITIAGGTVVFNHNLLFLRKLRISWDLISSHLLGTGLFGWSDEKWWLLLDNSEQFKRNFLYTVFQIAQSNCRLQMSRKLGLDCENFPSWKINYNLAYFSKNQLLRL